MTTKKRCNKLKVVTHTLNRQNLQKLNGSTSSLCKLPVLQQEDQERFQQVKAPASKDQQPKCEQPDIVQIK